MIVPVATEHVGCVTLDAGVAIDMFCVTVMLAVDEQPLDPVTVTVYVPAVVITAFALLPKPPSHA